ncbi:MAG: DNA primase [Prevotellaceae bacterium]|jgi:DNA primase|nr:DNA primase [Prevotellaceae bacterium]
MIAPATIEQIRDAAKIEEVVSDYVTLRRRGTNLIGLCPFHNEKTPSFNVNPARNIFKCFGCGKGGDPVHFIMEIEQSSYLDALHTLAKKYGIEIQERDLTPEEVAARSDRESMLLVNDFAQKHFHDNLHKHADGRAVGLSYFRERGFRDDTVEKFRLGFSLDEWQGLANAAISAGYKEEFLVKTGLCFKSEKDGRLIDRFRNRVMFPFVNLSGKIVGFGGRVLVKADNTAKYLNSPESELYHKSNELYGIFWAKAAIQKADRCFLVEGYTDVISMYQNGIENVVASSGTSLTEGQIRMIQRFTKNITLIYDGDPAGIKASLRGIDLFLSEGMNIKVLLLPDGDDPDSFARKTNATDLQEFIEKNSTDFIRFKIKLLLDDAAHDPVRRATAIGDILASIAKIPNQIIRAEYIKESSILLDLDEQKIYYEINKIKTRDADKKPLKKPDELSEGQQIPPDERDETGVKTDSVFDKLEYELLQLLARAGGELIFETETDKLTVAEYIFGELENDEIEFRNLLYNTFFKEYKNKYFENKNTIITYFKNHPNAQINNLAIDLIEEKYVLSKIFKEKEKAVEQTELDRKLLEKERIKKREKLNETVARVVLGYKNHIILERIRLKIIDLKIFFENADFENAEKTMLELKNLENLKNLLAKELGERVILKI